MNPSILPSKSFDKNYLLRLLNGNAEMMGVVLNEIHNTLPKCLDEIDSGLKICDSLGVVAYASRTKSAMHILQEEQLAETFFKIENAVRMGEWSSAENQFNSILNETTDILNSIKEAV